MRGADVAQGKKGTGAENRQIGVRVPPDIYGWIEAGKLPRESDTARVLGALEQLMDLERAAGARLPELRATALLQEKTLGQMVAELALEALDARKKKR